MSIQYSAPAWLDCSFESQTDKLVFLCLCDFASDQGECWPSITTVAKRCCMSERGVRYTLRRLTHQKRIRIKPGGGRAKSNSYILQINPANHSLNSIQGIPFTECNSVNPANDDLNPAPGAPDPLLTVKNRKSNGSHGDTKASTPPREGKNFKAPSLEELTEFCQPHGIDAEYFYDYYEARGWKFNGGGKMKNWKATVKMWAKRNKENNRNGEDPFSKHAKKNANKPDQGDAEPANAGSVCPPTPQW